MIPIRRTFWIQRTISTVSLFLMILSICTAVTTDENEKLCTIDPTTGEKECKAIYEDGAYDDPNNNARHQYNTLDDDEEDEYYDEEDPDYDDWSQCIDRNDECPKLASKGECVTNPGYMHFQCPVSCERCDDYRADVIAQDGEVCTDNDESCRGWAALNECSYNPGYMHYECRRSCLRCFVDTNQFGKTQTLPAQGDEHYDKTKEHIDKSTKYILGLWSGSNPDNDRVNYKCRNMEELCSYWAARGECESNPTYMQKNCAPACQTCELLDIRLKCPMGEDNEPVYKPGDLNNLMERIVDNSDGKGEFLKYNPKAISRPRRKGDGTLSGATDGPWIVQFENFVSEEEANALIAVGAKRGYERSSDVGEENPDGTHEENINDDRTSENAWCTTKLCNKDPLIGQVIQRIATVTESHETNSEHLQLLRYEPGQYYRQHHDYIEYQQELPCGPRALTVFLYLNDVEEGGGTHFPLLNLTVQPKLGNAIVWPSVLDKDPEAKDPRTDHEALAVVKGIKYGANAWIHTRNYWEAEERDCA